MPRPLRQFSTYPLPVWRMYKEIMAKRRLELEMTSFAEMIRLRCALHAFARSILASKDSAASEGISLLEWGCRPADLTAEQKVELGRLCRTALDTARDFYSSTKKTGEGLYTLMFSTKEDSLLAQIARKAMGWKTTDEQTAEAIDLIERTIRDADEKERNSPLGLVADRKAGGLDEMDE